MTAFSVLDKDYNNDVDIDPVLLFSCIILLH